MKKAKYICIEGVEGVGKTTQINLIKEALEAKGFTVIVTKEPGTSRVPLTQELRQIGLDKKNSDLVRGIAREYIWQAIRTIHLNHDVYPNLDQVDYILQDRGIPSGIAYGLGFNLPKADLLRLNNLSVTEGGAKQGITHFNQLYDHIIFFQTEAAANFLENAKNAKQEFKTGDGIEAEGSEFMESVLKYFSVALAEFPEAVVNKLNVEASPGVLKPKEEIRDEVLKIICCEV